MLAELGLPGKPAALNSARVWLQEAGMDDDADKAPKTHEVGMTLDAMSVDELTHRIGLLETEILRLRAAIAARNQTRQAAESVFKF